MSKTNNGKMIRTISNLLLQWQTHFLRTFYEHINHVIDKNSDYINDKNVKKHGMQHRRS